MRFVALRATVPTGGRRSLACTPLRPLEAVPRSEPSRRFTSRAPPASGGPCRAPPGETLMIGSARSPRPHEKGGVALMLAGPGIIAAGFALARDAGRRPVASSPGGGPLSRAILPLRGTRPEGSHPDSWGLGRRGPAGRCADRRSAFPCLRAIRSVGGPARLHLHSNWLGGRRSPVFPAALVRLSRLDFLTMKITEKGQVTIPQRLRQAYGLLPNTEVIFEAGEDCVVLRSRLSRRGLVRERIRRARGAGTGKRATDDIMRLTRGED